MRVLFLLFIVMPILEMWLLLEVGGVIGALSTIGLVLLTAAVGFALLRQQGFDTLKRGNWKMQQGQMPAQEMAEGLILAVSGALLLTPGFITDVIGFAGLTPMVRYWMFRKLMAKATVAGARGGIYEHHQPGEPEQSNTIEGSYRRED